MKAAAVLVLVVVAMMTTTSTTSHHAMPIKHYAGKLPKGRDVMFFLHVCSVCGEFYGGKLERRCIMDKTFLTFSKCVAAILLRRRK